MLRHAAGKVMWVGKATVFLVGLAMILALIFGAATAALGAMKGCSGRSCRRADGGLDTMVP